MKITLQQILEGLSHETLSFMADSDAAGTIVGDQIPKVIGRVNATLRKLAVKFTLSEKTVRVRVTADRRIYTLTNGAAWIVSEPGISFVADVARILGIETPSGRMHPMNDLAKHDSIMLKNEGRAFMLDAHMPVGIYTVVYKAETPKFKTDGSDLTQVIEIPEALLNALYIGVAAITYEGIGGPENIQMANVKWAAFEKECGEAKINSAVETEQYEDSNLFMERGFR
jgi:hypothetical protein